MVARQDRDAVAALDPEPIQAVRQGVHRVVQFGVGDGPLVIDDRGPRWAAVRPERGHRADLAEPVKVANEARQHVRRIQFEHPRLDDLAKIMQLSATALRKGLKFREERPFGGDRHDRQPM
ncbi:Uncharacterised protein [Mycobacteroides abscessus subsp. abscessus]|nr:Uncharacterised protein [Mycobacteroides abscessus subsp. abscessus]